LEMAFGAAREILEAGECILEQVQFQKALFLPDGDEAPTTQLIFYPADGSFAIHSRAADSDQSWVQHAIGYMRKPQDEGLIPKIDREAVQKDLSGPTLPDTCYEGLAQMGLYFGPSFRGMERIWRKDGEVLGEIRLPEHLEPESQSYCVHPVLLDSCFQVVAAAIPLDVLSTLKSSFLPVLIERVRLYRSPRRRILCHAHLTSLSKKVIEADIRVYDEDGELLMVLENYTCQAVDGVRSDDTENMENWLYDVQWHNRPLPEKRQVHRPVDTIPCSREIAESVTSEVHRLSHELGWSGIFGRMEESSSALPVAYVIRALRELGLRFSQGDSLTLDALMEQLNVVPRHQRLMRRFMEMLEGAGYLKKAGTDEWMICQVPPDRDPQEMWRNVLSEFPVFFAELSLIARCGRHLAAVLRGDTDPLQLIFTPVAVEHFFQDSPSYRLGNSMVQKAVGRALERLREGRTIRILEVGAGTGGMTASVLPVLPANQTEYVFSDVSQPFLSRAEQRFRDYPFVKYQTLDIEKDPLEQDYRPHSFDIVVASDVLHSTGDVRDALKNVRQLLSSEGLFVFLEAERAFPWAELVFGLTEAWWRFRDFDLRPDQPLISGKKWKNVLEEARFTDIVDMPADPSNQFVMLARGPRIEGDAQDTAEEPDFQAASGEKGNWLIFADRGGIAEGLAERLTSCGEECVLVAPGERFQRIDEAHFRISPTHREDMERLLRTVGVNRLSWRGAVHLWSLDVPSLQEATIDSLQGAEALCCYSVMHFIQALSNIELGNNSPRLILTTRGAQPVGQEEIESLAVGQSPLIGVGKVIINEPLGIRCKMVDLGLDNASKEVQSLFSELWTEDPEEEIALRHEARFVPRLEHVKAEKVPVKQECSGDKGQRDFRLEIVRSGVIDNLTLRETGRSQPGPGQVGIEVCAASLNFRDVMKVLGLYPSGGDDYMIPGDECAGRIVEVGEGVEGVERGDEVMAIAPASLASYTTTSAALVMTKPAYLTFEEAVTIPIAFLTAYYALHYPGGIAEGERVLIQSAAGGVGLAALQVARHAGAEIFATAGSPEKRELLEFLGVKHIMDSR
jgi:SAM-dependent methyltransferase